MASNQGISSKNVRHTTAPKVEPKPHAKRPAGTAALGSMYGDHATNRPGSTGFKGEKLDGGRGYSPPVGPTDNVAACGVGGGRTVFKTGSQQQYESGGPEKPSGREILGSFGPESSRPRGES
jgi:hypothetical protein